MGKRKALCKILDSRFIKAESAILCHWQRSGSTFYLNPYKPLNTTSLVMTIKIWEASYLWSPGYLTTHSDVISSQYSHRDHILNFALINMCLISPSL